MRNEVSAGGIVYNPKTEKVLLILDSYGRWAFPKGHVEKGETIPQAAIRETSEEVGLKNLKIVKKLGTIKYVFRLKGQLISKVVHVFLMLTEETKLKPQWEIQGAKWYDIDKAVDRVDYDNSKEIAKKAVSEIRKMKW